MVKKIHLPSTSGLDSDIKGRLAGMVAQIPYNDVLQLLKTEPLVPLPGGTFDVLQRQVKYVLLRRKPTEMSYLVWFEDLPADLQDLLLQPKKKPAPAVVYHPATEPVEPPAPAPAAAPAAPSAEELSGLGWIVPQKTALSEGSVWGVYFDNLYDETANKIIGAPTYTDFLTSKEDGDLVPLGEGYYHRVSAEAPKIGQSGLSYLVKLVPDSDEMSMAAYAVLTDDFEQAAAAYAGAGPPAPPPEVEAKPTPKAYPVHKPAKGKGKAHKEGPAAKAADAQQQAIQTAIATWKPIVQKWEQSPMPQVGTPPYWDYQPTLVSSVNGPEAAAAVQPLLGDPHVTSSGPATIGWYWELVDGTVWGAHDLISAGGKVSQPGFYVRHDPNSLEGSGVAEGLQVLFARKEEEVKRAQKLKIKAENEKVQKQLQKLMAFDPAAWDYFVKCTEQALKSIEISQETELLLTPIETTASTDGGIKYHYLQAMGISTQYHSKFLSAWAGSAKSSGAKQMQLASADFLGYLKIVWPGYSKPERDVYVAGREQGLRSYIAERAWCQVVIGQIEPFVVYRGFKVQDSITGQFREAKQQGKPIEAKLWPLTSWTTLQSVGHTFAGSGGVVLKKIVPVDRVFTAYRVASELLNDEREAIIECPMWGEPDVILPEEVITK